MSLKSKLSKKPSLKPNFSVLEEKEYSFLEDNINYTVDDSVLNDKNIDTYFDDTIFDCEVYSNIKPDLLNVIKENNKIDSTKTLDEKIEINKIDSTKILDEKIEINKTTEISEKKLKLIKAKKKVKFAKETIEEKPQKVKFAEKTIKKSIRVKPEINKSFKKKKKTRKSNNILESIRKIQLQIKPCIPKEPFKRLIRELVQKSSPTDKSYRMTKESLIVLEEVAQDYLTQYFNIANKLAIHRNRITVSLKDLNFIRDNDLINK